MMRPRSNLTQGAYGTAQSAPRVLGCDPGLGGALALIVGRRQLVSIWDMPTFEGLVCPMALQALFVSLRIDLIVIERAGARFGGLKLGAAFATIYSVARLLKIPVKIVAPITWKSALDLSSDKDLSRAQAGQLWPEHAPLFDRRQDHNRAEAALIAYWGQQHYTNIGPLITDQMRAELSAAMAAVKPATAVAAGKIRGAPRRPYRLQAPFNTSPPTHAGFLDLVTKMLIERGAPAPIYEIQDYISEHGRFSFGKEGARLLLLRTLDSPRFERFVQSGMRMWRLRSETKADGQKTTPIHPRFAHLRRNSV